jgi:hypothetical protein
LRFPAKRACVVVAASDGVAQLAAAGSSLDRQKFLQCRRCASMTERPRKKLG